MFAWVLEISFVKKIFHLWKKYEHWFGSAALLAGFCFDLIFANRPDSLVNNILLLCYLLIAGGLIIVLNIQKTRRLELEHPAEPMFLLVALQFLFGNLSSNLLVLYGRSGTFAGSAIFLILLFSMLLGNEFLKTRYGQLRFNIAVYYLLVFSYLIISVPTFIFHTIGVPVFLASGVISLVFISVFLAAVYRFILRGKYRKRYLFEVGVYIAGIFFAFNIFYFLNVIPPVPLSLKDIGIYHSVSRIAAGEYAGTFEKPSWFAFWRATSPVYHFAEGSPAYCFSSVFAPTGLGTPVVHSWEKYNESTGKWQVLARVTFAISGGRDGGYRGFSTKTLGEGSWRCDVETEGGQLIGRMSFTASSGSPPDLASKRL